MEFAFDELKLKTLKAKIANDNWKAILFNESIGYEISIEQSESLFQYYFNTKDKFIRAISGMRNTLNKLSSLY